jgi:hypothetical protein
VDSFVVSGIDFTYEDTSVDPPMKVPLRTLDVGISRITNRALVEQRPVRFSVVLGSGKVTLPRRLGVGLFSSVAGGVADAATVAGGGEVADLGKTEERLFFEEVLLNGNVALYPAPTGWMKVGVSGLELANLKGLASKTAVTLEGGIFDLTSDLRMRDGTVLKKTRVAFDSLVVSEQPDGPILRYLHLPTPVQGVVFVLRDEEDTIHIPLRVRAEKGVLNTASLTGAILESLATVIARAIAASPLRLATALVPGGSEDKQPGDEPIPLEFEAGGIDVSRAALAGLAPLIERLIADDEVAVTLRHELGAGDFERMRVRANPPREEAIQIAEGLRAKRADLLRVRSEAVERARATFAAGLIEEERLARTAVRDLDAELGNTERALDKLGDLLRRGAENREPRRTRAACIELGRERLAAVHEALIKALAEQIPGIEERLRIERAKAGEPVVEAGGRVLAIAGRKKL